jgi:Lon protease-like protein
MRRITRLPYAAVVPAPLPLFPLNTPLVPGLVLPLHIFEPRYREMVQELLERPDEDDREFGIVAVRDGRDVAADGMAALYPVGTAAILRQAEQFDDGRFDIVTTGSRRFRLLEVDSRQPLLRAHVEYLDDVSDPADALLAEQVTRRFRLYRGALSGQVPDAVDWDDTEDDADLPDDPTVLSYLVTAAMLLPTDERQGLLAAATTGDRLVLARSLLGRETALISTLSAVPSLDIPGIAPSVN